MAVAMAVFRLKQSARLAATLYSPPETWTSKERALRNGMTPGSSRCTRAPRERKSSSHESWRIVKPLMNAPECKGAFEEKHISARNTGLGPGSIRAAELHAEQFAPRILETIRI